MRTEVVGIRFTAEEHRRLRALAERSERTPSDFIRQLVLRVSPELVTTGIPSPAMPGKAQAEPECSMAT